MTTAILVKESDAARRKAAGRPSFHFVMALLMVALVLYGFSQTIVADLIHPDIPRPAILYVHAAVFSAWLTLYLVQTALASTHSLRLHRRLGLAWLCVGAAVPIVGVSTAIVMRRFDIVHFEDTLPFLAVPLWDMLFFSGCFVLAALWRKRAAWHPRLMFLATCCLLDAAFSRFPLPDAWFDHGFFYAAIDGLVLIAIARDLLLQRRVHPVFRTAVPLMIVGQTVAWALWQHPPAAWIVFCRAVVGAG